MSAWTKPQIVPGLLPLLEDPRSAIWPPREGQSLASYRQRLDAPLAAAKGPAMARVIELRALQSDGKHKVPLRLYRPSLAAGLPIIIFIHGGGFVVGSLETHDALCRSLAAHSGAAVISVGYRLAPEAPYPAPLDDCVTALKWIYGIAPSLQLDAARLAICGDSAGGQLAIASCLQGRHEGIEVCHLGLVYPMIDPKCESASTHQFAEGHLLTRSVMQWFWQCYAGHDVNTADPRLAVMDADLRDLPPTTVLTAELDPLRDEGEAFTRRIEANGVMVVARRYLGMPHGFMSLCALTTVADRAIQDLSSDIRTSFENS